MAEIYRIQYVIDHFKKVDNGRLSQNLVNHLGDVKKEELDDAIAFVHSYLDMIMQVMEVFRKAGKEAGKNKTVEGVLEKCVAYFRKNKDYLNDHQYGLYGILDDAYFTMSMLLTIQQSVTGLNLPFEEKALKDVNLVACSLLPNDVVKQIDADVWSMRTQLLLGSINDWAEEQKPKRGTVTLRDKQWNFPFKVYKLSEDISELNNRKGIYAITRLDNENGKSIHKIIFFGVALDCGKLLSGVHPQGKAINAYKPTHICVYDNSQDWSKLKGWCGSLINYYSPPVKEQSTSKINLTTHSQKSNSYTSYRPTTSNYNYGKKQCPTCSGSGSRVCSSCGGSGGRSQSRVDYDWQGNPVYNTEWINCYSCSGGYSTCNHCGGSGQVN